MIGSLADRASGARRRDPARPVVFVLRQTGLGDLASGVPAIRGIRRAFPGHWMQMSCPPWLVPLAERLNLADELLSGDALAGSPLDHEATEAPTLAQALGADVPPDVVVVLCVPKPEVLRAVLESGASRVVAYRHPAVEATAAFPELSLEDHILVRWERLLGNSGILTDRRDLHIELGAGEATDLRPEADAPTLLHVGAASAARRWPEERWAAVARALEACGHRVVLSGSPQEAGIVERVRVRAGLPADRDLCGRTSALELAELVRGARLVLSCDTGVAHLAFGLRRPSVTLFGAVPPASWGPPPDCPLHRTIWKGRYGEPYADRSDAGLLEVSVADVLSCALAVPHVDPFDPFTCPFLAVSASVACD